MERRTESRQSGTMHVIFTLNLVHADCTDEFFLGAGDINSSFLPPVKDGSRKSGASDTSGTAAPGTLADGISTEDSLTRKAQMLDKLSEERPLQKLQEEMDKGTDEGANGGGDAEPEDCGKVEPGDEKRGDEAKEAPEESTTPPSSPPPKRRPLLKAEDGELPRIASVSASDLIARRADGRSCAKSIASFTPAMMRGIETRTRICRMTAMPLYVNFFASLRKCGPADIQYIITEMKSQVLQGCSVVFSGLIPLHQRPET
jgi:RNA polymerase II subunit A-like phosphatase